MEKIELWGGDIDNAHTRLQIEKERLSTPTYCNFNGKEITSEMSLDECYQTILGMSKQEWDEAERARSEERKRKEQQHKDNIPSLIETYIEKAKGIIADEYMDLWTEIVPIRLSDLYKGMELQCTLDVVVVLNKEGVECDVFKDAKIALDNQNHSGMSYGLMLSMIKAFHINGAKFVEYVKSID